MLLAHSAKPSCSASTRCERPNKQQQQLVSINAIGFPVWPRRLCMELNK